MIDFEHLTNPEKYHTVPPRAEGEKDEQYKARLRAYVQGIKSQQAKIDELQRKIAFQERAIKNIKLQFENKQIDCDRSDRKIDELQARIDEALHAADESCGVSVAAFVKLNKILKGNKDEN